MASPRTRTIACLSTAALLLLLAGGASAANGGNHGRNVSSTHTLDDCTARQNFIPIAYADAQAHMPDGWEAATWFESWGGAAHPVDTLGELSLAFFDCPTGTYNGAVLEHPRFAAAIVMSRTPPPAFARAAAPGDLQHYGIMLGAFHSDPTVQQLWKDWGLATSDLASVTMDQAGAADVLAIEDAAADGMITVNGAIVPGNRLPPQPMEHLRFFFADGTTLTGFMDVVVGSHLVGLGGSTVATHNATGWVADLPHQQGASLLAHVYGNWDLTFTKGFLQEADTTVMTGCVGHQGLFPVPYAAAQAMMPAGFTAATYLEGQGAPRDPTLRQGELDILFLDCSGGRVGAHNLDDVRFVGAFVVASVPPAPYAGNVQHYGIAAGAMASHQSLVHEYEDWGLTMERGAIDFTQGALGSFADEADNGALTMSGRIPTAATMEIGAESTRIFFVEAGQVIGGLDSPIGPHTVALGEGSFQRGAGWPAEFPAASASGAVGQVVNPVDLVFERIQV